MHLREGNLKQSHRHWYRPKNREVRKTQKASRLQAASHKKPVKSVNISSSTVAQNILVNQLCLYQERGHPSEKLAHPHDFINTQGEEKWLKPQKYR